MVLDESEVAIEGTPDEAADNLVPGWLAILVLLLLLGVAALTGYIVRDMVISTEKQDAAPSTVREIQKEVDADPTDLAMRLQLAYAYQEDGRFEDALREYEQVLMLESEDTAALYNKGVVLLELGRDQEGEDALIMVLGIASDHVLAAKTLAQHYLDSDEPGAALAVIEPIVAEREEYADLQYIGGAASEALGRVDDAVAYYMRALKYAPDLVEARNGLERLGPDAGTP